MIKQYNSSFNVNKFLKDISLKKKYIKNFKDSVFILSTLKETNYRSLNNKMIQNNSISNLHNNLVMFIIDITFSKSNTLLNVSDSNGNLKFSCSAGSFNYSGKSKRSRWIVFKEFYSSLLKLKFLTNKPIALHFKNVGSHKFWIIKKLKKIFFIKNICSFNSYPYNGCRKKKMRRKKFKKLRKSG